KGRHRQPGPAEAGGGADPARGASVLPRDLRRRRCPGVLSLGAPFAPSTLGSQDPGVSRHQRHGTRPAPGRPRSSPGGRARLLVFPAVPRSDVFPPTLDAATTPLSWNPLFKRVSLTVPGGLTAVSPGDTASG